MIRLIKPSDYSAITSIYNYYITNTISTFEIEELTLEQQTRRITTICQQFPYFVYEERERILGFCYVHNFHPRTAYNKSIEFSIYLDHECQTKGLGSQLTKQMITYLKEKTDFHTLISLISLPNIASQHLHQKYGFTYCGKLKEVGYKFDRWIDVGYYQLLL